MTGRRRSGRRGFSSAGRCRRTSGVPRDHVGPAGDALLVASRTRDNRADARVCRLSLRLPGERRRRLGDRTGRPRHRKAGAWNPPEVGFLLHPDHWGGLCPEAMATLIPLLFARHEVPALTADVDPRNTASLRLLDRLGFRETGRAERTLLARGVVRRRMGVNALKVTFFRIRKAYGSRMESVWLFRRAMAP